MTFTIAPQRGDLAVASHQCVRALADIMIYDEESDRHVHITFEQAMRATSYGALGGPYLDIFNVASMPSDAIAKMVLEDGTPDAAGRKVFTDFAAESACLDPADEQDQADVRAAFLEAVINLVKGGKWVPIEIVVARPFIEHLMLSAVVAVAGRETGATLFGCAVRPRTRRSALHPTLLLSVQLRAQAGRHADLGQHEREDDRRYVLLCYSSRGFS